MSARCPVCGVASADGDLFCEADGARLGAATSVRPNASACPTCGGAGTDDGDGFCGACGHRLPHDQLATEPPPAPVLPGSDLGGYRVRAEGPRGTLWVDGEAEALFLVRGDAAALALEAAALEALADAPNLARVTAQTNDRRHGALLALRAPESARSPAEGLAASAVARACAALLDLAAALERAGYTAAPLPGDVVVLPDGEPFVLRLRGAARLAAGSALDPRPFLAALGDGPPLGWVGAPIAAVRLLAACRRGASVAPRDIAAARAALGRALVETPIAGPLGAASDPGLVREHDQDATAFAEGSGWAVLVVCDGVSSSTRSAEASALAARTTRDALAHFARSGDVDFEAAGGAVTTAIRAAHIATCAELGGGDESDLPGTTLVAALVHHGRITIGWVGDSRAYWVGPGGAELLTRDHSWVTEVVTAGVMDERAARRAPEAHIITRCLWPLEVGSVIAEAEPEVRGRDVPGPGLLVLCSDGLWNYLDSPDDLARLVRAIDPGASAEGVARALVGYALSRGGNDNVSVVAYRHRPSNAW